MVFLHDELGPFNDPCYLLQFVEWAQEHGLHYIGDAQLFSMFPRLLPAAAARSLAALAPDPVQAEQVMDYVRQRSFRGSLLTRAEAAGGATFRSRRCATARLAPASGPGCPCPTCARGSGCASPPRRARVWRRTAQR